MRTRRALARVRLTTAAILLTMTPLMAGCGLIFGGTRQTIRVSSSPDGAAIATMPGTVDYKTPTTLNLERKNEYVLTFSMPGYTSQKVELQRDMRVGIVVLDILTGLVGVIVDAVTGAWYRLSPEVVSVTLTKVGAGIPGPETITVEVTTTPADDAATADLRIEATVPGVLVEAHAR